MTGRGSVTPGMACGSRPVEGSPQLGAFPAVGIRQRPGIAKGEAFSPLARRRPPQVGKIANVCKAEPDKRRLGKSSKPTNDGTDVTVPEPRRNRIAA
jgi:hypothetical protein